MFFPLVFLGFLQFALRGVYPLSSRSQLTTRKAVRRTGVLIRRQPCPALITFFWGSCHFFSVCLLQPTSESILVMRLLRNRSVIATRNSLLNFPSLSLLSLGFPVLYIFPALSSCVFCLLFLWFSSFLSSFLAAVVRCGGRPYFPFKGTRNLDFLARFSLLPTLRLRDQGFYLVFPW